MLVAACNVRGVEMYENYSGLGVAFLPRPPEGYRKNTKNTGLLDAYSHPIHGRVYRPSLAFTHGFTSWRRFQTRTRKRNARVWLAQIKPSLRVVSIRQRAGRVIGVHLPHHKSRHPGFADPSGEVRQFPFRDSRRISVAKGLSIIPVDDAPAILSALYIFHPASVCAN